MPNPRILIVDDDPVHRWILTRQLAKIEAFEMHEASHGQQALLVSTTEVPDLIFMDLGLPLLDGWEAIRHIRNFFFKGNKGTERQ